MSIQIKQFAVNNLQYTHTFPVGHPCDPMEIDTNINFTAVIVQMDLCSSVIITQESAGIDFVESTSSGLTVQTGTGHSTSVLITSNRPDSKPEMVLQLDYQKGQDDDEVHSKVVYAIVNHFAKRWPLDRQAEFKKWIADL